MGRRAQGPAYRPVGGIWVVRFTVAKKRHELSTGIAIQPGETRASAAAQREGQRLWAQALLGKPVGRAKRAAHGEPWDVSLLEWVETAAIRERTRREYRVLVGQWIAEWSTWPTEQQIASYARARLRAVQRKTLVNELSALRSFSRWAAAEGLAQPLAVPEIPKSSLGTAHPVRRRVRAPELSAPEVEALIAELPERSRAERPGESGGYPVRARFVVAWDTGLRPATLDQLSVPEHWSPGAVALRITAAIDKEGNARDVPLTARALAALASVAPPTGLIFGAHRYERFLRPAAARVLPAAKAAIFTAQHTRSAAITRMLESSANLAGVMHLAGHTQAATTSRYARPTMRAALAVLESLGAPPEGSPPQNPKPLSGEDSGEGAAT